MNTQYSTLVRIESLGKETRAASDSIRRESNLKLNESRAAAERFAIVKYKHSEQYKSLQMPQQALKVLLIGEN